MVGLESHIADGGGGKVAKRLAAVLAAEVRSAEDPDTPVVRRVEVDLAVIHRPRLVLLICDFSPPSTVLTPLHAHARWSREDAPFVSRDRYADASFVACGYTLTGRAPSRRRRMSVDACWPTRVEPQGPQPLYGRVRVWIVGS